MKSLFNIQGNELVEQNDLYWKIIVHERAVKLGLKWSKIPPSSIHFMQQIVKSFFSKNKISAIDTTFSALIKLHKWLGERTLLSYDELTSSDYQVFKTWLKEENYSTFLLHNTMSSLKLIWEEAILLQLTEATTLSLKAIKDFNSSQQIVKTAIQTIINTAGSKLLMYKDNQWKIIYSTRKGTVRSHTFDWSALPLINQGFVKAVVKSVFDQNRIGSCISVTKAFNNLHTWVNNPQFFEYALLTEEDYSRFDQWLEHTNEYDLTTRRTTFTYIKFGYNEAVTLRRPEISPVAINTISEVMPRRFRNINKKSTLKAVETVLSSKEVDQIYEMISKELRSIKSVLEKPQSKYIGFIENPGIPGYRYIRTLDLIGCAAMWLALDSGLRPEEICNLELNDIIEDNNGHGFHKLRCKGSQSKPDRYVPIDDRCLHILQLLINWTNTIRTECPSQALFIDWTISMNDSDKCTARRMDSRMLNKRFMNLFKKYDLRYDSGKPLEASLRIFRKTLGAQLAASTQNREKVRRIMGHTSFFTTEGYYLTQARSELSHNVADALRPEARRLAILYKTPVLDLHSELPDIAEALLENPDRDIEFGICSVPQTTTKLSSSCRRAPTCLECKFLVPEAHKRHHYVMEMEVNLAQAQNEEDERTAQQRLKRAAMAQGYIQLIDRRLEEDSVSIDSTKRRRTYKPK